MNTQLRWARKGALIGLTIALCDLFECAAYNSRHGKRVWDRYRRALLLTCATGDDARAILVGSPARIHSTIFAIVKPCAARIASVQPSALAASNSSARRVVTEALPWFFCA